MEKIEIRSEECAEKIGTYSEGLKSGNLIFTTQIGLTKEGFLIDERIASQTDQCLRNINSIMKATGARMDNIVKCTVYLTDMDDFAAMNEIYKNYFTKPYPSRTCLQVVKLPGGAKVEIEAIANLIQEK